MDGFTEDYEDYSTRFDRETSPSVLVIDDMRDIVGLPSDAVVCRTLERGWRTLYSQPWTTVYLDHDLGYDEEGVDKVTIRPLVQQLENDAATGTPPDVGEFVVITSSPYGGDWMMAALSPYYKTTRAQVSSTTNWDAFKDARQEREEDARV